MRQSIGRIGGGHGLFAGLLTLGALTGLLWAGTVGAQAPAGGGRTMVLDRVVASVNDEAITLSEIQEEAQPVIRKIYQEFVGGERDRRVDEAQRRLLEELIDRRLMLQVARREGMLPAAAEVQGALEELKRNNNASDDAQFRALLKAEGLTLEQVRRTIYDRLAIGRTLARQVRSSVLISEEELTRYYEAHPEKFQRKPEAEIRLILVAVSPDRDEAAAKARAEEALAKIRGGADFAQVARDYSDSPTRERGGEMGVVHKGDLAPEVEAQAFGLPPGGVSPPIRTESGWNLIKVERVQASPLLPFDQAREEARNEVLAQKFEGKRKEWIASLRNRASIQILPEPLEPPAP
jgi:parvulin-like peptidyl-prolyl isomerase